VWAINAVFLSALSLSKSSTGETAAHTAAAAYSIKSFFLNEALSPHRGSGALLLLLLLR
jgi:hypothetical protein